MKDNRLQNNGRQQNTHLYTLFSMRDDNYTWDMTADYYVPSKMWDRRFSITKQLEYYYTRQIGIVVLEDSIREVLENMSINDYAVRDMTGYTINQAILHTCFNDYVRDNNTA